MHKITFTLIKDELKVKVISGVFPIICHTFCIKDHCLNVQCSPHIHINLEQVQS